MKKNFAAAIALSLSMVAGWARAGGFDPKQVPEDAKWVVHVDMDATRKTKVWDLLQGKIKQDAPTQEKIDAVSNLIGIRFPDDVHGLTIYGRSFADQSSAVLLDATMDAEKISTLLKANEAYKKITYGSHEIISWLDKDSGKTMFGTFATPTLAVIADSVEQVQAALDVLDGKSKSIQPGDTLAQGKGTTILFYLAGDGISGIAGAQKPESPLLSQVNSAWFTVCEEDQKVMARASMITTNTDSAEQVKSMIEGVRAMVVLSANGAQADLKVKLAARVLQGLVVKSEGRTVYAELPVPMDTVSSILDTMGKAATAVKDQPNEK